MTIPSRTLDDHDRFRKANRFLRLTRGAAVALLAVTLCACGDSAETPSVVNPPVQKTPEAGEVLGKVIRFGIAGEGRTYQVSGWSGTEPADSTWSEGKSAVLRLPVPANAGPLKLRLKMAAFTFPSKLVSQAVEIYANGTKIAQWDVASIAEFTAQIPADMGTSSQWLNLELVTPNSTSPKALGANEDARVLGVCLYELELTKGG
jgi:hypothetical protein